MVASQGVAATSVFGLNGAHATTEAHARQAILKNVLAAKMWANVRRVWRRVRAMHNAAGMILGPVATRSVQDKKFAAMRWMKIATAMTSETLMSTMLKDPMMPVQTALT